MARFIIEPHFRLQEWVAEEKGYFKAEGLDYEFRELVQATDGKIHDKGDKVGAYQAFEKGRAADVSCACHWTVGVAASSGHGKLYPDLYSVTPAGVFVPADSPVKIAGGPGRRADLGRLPVGQPLRDHPGARAVHGAPTRSTCRSPTACCSSAWSCCSTARCRRARLFSGPYYLAEQLGFRKIIDASFMIATMVHGNPDPEDLKKFFSALRLAQRDIDLRPERYTHYYKREFPVRWHAVMDTRRWGPGERLVFEPYTKEVFDETFKWIADRGIFADTGMGSCRYEQSIAGAAP